MYVHCTLLYTYYSYCTYGIQYWFISRTSEAGTNIEGSVLQNRPLVYLMTAYTVIAKRPTDGNNDDFQFFQQLH